MAFNPGDKVKRTGGSFAGTVVGGVYTVTQQDGNNLSLQEMGGVVYAADKFALVGAEEPGPQWPFAVGDKVVRKAANINGMFPDQHKVYIVEGVRPGKAPDGSPTYKIRVQGISGYWYGEKFELAVAKAAPVPFVPAVGVAARIKAHGPWTTLGVQMQSYAGKMGVITHGTGDTFRIVSIHPNYWWRIEDLEEPGAAGDNYVPPPPRKVKVYNAERVGA